MAIVSTFFGLKANLFHVFVFFFQIASAKLLYQELNKGKPSFQFEHCWNVLRFQPKWLEDCQKKKPVKNKIRSPTVCASNSENEVILGDDNNEGSNLVDLERPPRRKAKKDKKKRKGKDIESDSSSYVNLL